MKSYSVIQITLRMLQGEERQKEATEEEMGKECEQKTRD
jgi:hypothetical protein